MGGGSEAVWKFSENSSNLVQVMLPKGNGNGQTDRLTIEPIELAVWGQLKIRNPKHHEKYIQLLSRHKTLNI